MPCDEVKKTLGYAENKKWAEVLIKDGYTVNDAAQTARNGLKCMSISIATGDFGDLYEAVSGKDICTGEALSYSERILSVAGIVVLNGRVWRGIGKTLSLSPEVRKLAQSTDELIESAKKIGFDHADDIKKNVGTIEKWKSSFKTSKIDDAQSINKELAEIGYSKPPYTDGTKVVSFKPDTATDFVRVHGDSNQAGRWVMNKNDIQGLSPSQIKEKFALPEVPSKVSDVTVPAGTNMRIGSVAPNYGSTGGGTQFEILERVDFINPRPLGDL